MANLFLLPLKSIADLFGIESIPALLYKNIEKDTPNKVPLSERTFRDVFNGKKQPTPQSLVKLSSMIPFLDWDHSHTFSNYMTGWEFFVQSPSYEYFPFPYFKKEFASFAIEIKEALNYGSEAEQIQFVFNHPFIHSFLTPAEISIITTGSDFNTDKKIVLSKLRLRILLYCIAYIDAEYGISRKEDRGDRFSFIKKILPTFDEDKYINPVSSFFKLLHDHYGRTYAEMEKSIIVDTNNPDKTASQKRKFSFWRKGEKRASYDEIKSIFHTLEPELEDIELNRATLLYYYSLFLHNLFDESLKSKIDGADLFKIDRELVEWIKTHYDDYFEKAYVEIERLIAKDAKSTFS